MNSLVLFIFTGTANLSTIKPYIIISHDPIKYIQCNILGCAEKSMERLIRNTCESVILTSMHPRSAMTIVLQEICNDGSVSFDVHNIMFTLNSWRFLRLYHHQNIYVPEQYLVDIMLYQCRVYGNVECWLSNEIPYSLNYHSHTG